MSLVRVVVPYCVVDSGMWIDRVEDGVSVGDSMDKQRATLIVYLKVINNNIYKGTYNI